jgi:hypothetical protein
VEGLVIAGIRKPAQKRTSLVHACRQLFANAAIAASRVGS